MNDNGENSQIISLVKEKIRKGKYKEALLELDEIIKDNI